jgi:DNA-binding GntR family transcriptional regulator
LRIIALKLVPGQNLSRVEIADFYRVSQTPVRDAMMRLEEEGLLVVRPQSRTQVSRFYIDHARETQFLRLALKLEVVRKLALAPNPISLAQSRRILAQRETALATWDINLFFRLDRLFHRSLCEAAGVCSLWRVIAARSGHIDRMRNLNLPDPGKPNEILTCHRGILSTIEAGDIDASTTALREHPSGTLASVDAIREWTSQFF